MGETTQLPDFTTEIIIPLFAVMGIVFAIALFQWLLVSKVKLSADKYSSTDSKNGFNEAFIEEEEGANEHSVVRKCAEIQAAISEETAAESRSARRAALEASLRDVLFQIIRFVNDKKDHVPPIPNLEGVSFPYEITISRIG